jgi:hypothetical protein
MSSLNGISVNFCRKRSAPDRSGGTSRAAPDCARHPTHLMKQILAFAYYGCVSDMTPLFVLVDMMKNPAPLLAFGNQPPTAVLE